MVELTPKTSLPPDHPGALGAADREPAAPVGAPHHVHRAHPQPHLRLLEPPVRDMRAGDREARQGVHGQDGYDGAARVDG